MVGVAEGGIPETIVDGETGYLVPREPVAFLKAVKKAIANNRDLGKKARLQMRQNWDIEKLSGDVINTILK